MRLYTFINFYLSSIQQGIQTAHITHELFTKYAVSSGGQVLLLNDWAHDHKTIITLNGGNNESLNDLHNFICDADHENPYPFTAFHEDQASLGGIMTGVGIVLPEKIYVAAEMIRNKKWEFAIRPAHNGSYYSVHDKSDGGLGYIGHSSHSYSSFEVELIDKMNACPLAR